MTYFGSDPLAGYTPTWRQSSSSDVQTATNFSGGDDDDPLQGYTPNWRQQLSGSHGGATGDIDLRDDDDDPLAGYTPDWRKRHQASVVEQAHGGLEQVGEALRHPLRTISGIVTSGLRDAYLTAADAVFPDQSDDEETRSEVRRAAINTTANSILPLAPGSGVVGRAAIGAGLGAVNDPEQPIRGATAGLLLNEVLHQSGRAAGAGASAANRRFLDVTDGAVGSGARGVDEQLRNDVGDEGQSTRMQRVQREAELGETFNQRPEGPAGAAWWEHNAPQRRTLPPPPEQKLLTAGARPMPGELDPSETLARARRIAMLSEAERTAENPLTTDDVLERIRARDRADRMESDRTRANAPNDAAAATASQSIADNVTLSAAAKQYRAMTTPDLYDQMIAEYDRIDALQPSMGGGWSRMDDDIHASVSGNSFAAGRARQQAKFAAQRITKIESELRTRGIADDELGETMQARRESATERAGIANDTRSDDALDFLFGKNVGGTIGEQSPAYRSPLEALGDRASEELRNAPIVRVPPPSVRVSGAELTTFRNAVRQHVESNYVGQVFQNEHTNAPIAVSGEAIGKAFANAKRAEVVSALAQLPDLIRDGRALDWEAAQGGTPKRDARAVNVPAWIQFAARVDVGGEPLVMGFKAAVHHDGQRFFYLINDIKPADRIVAPHTGQETGRYATSASGLDGVSSELRDQEARSVEPRTQNIGNSSSGLNGEGGSVAETAPRYGRSIDEQLAELRARVARGEGPTQRAVLPESPDNAQLLADVDADNQRQARVDHLRGYLQQILSDKPEYVYGIRGTQARREIQRLIADDDALNAWADAHTDPSGLVRHYLETAETPADAIANLERDAKHATYYGFRHDAEMPAPLSMFDRYNHARGALDAVNAAELTPEKTVENPAYARGFTDMQRQLGLAERRPDYSSPDLRQAFDDWTSGRAYLGNDGNYRLKGDPFVAGAEMTPRVNRARVAPWNRIAKATFPDADAFHHAAERGGMTAASAEPDQMELGLAERRGRFRRDSTDPAQLNAFDAAMRNPESAIANEMRAENQARAFGTVDRRNAALEQVDRLKRAGIPTSDERLAQVRGTKRHQTWVDLRGRQLRTPQDVHTVLTSYRHPGMERMHVLLLDNDNRILSHTAETSGALGFVDMGADRRWTQGIIDRAQRLGATRAVIAHNHPSGDPIPSSDDIGFTEYLGGQLQQSGIQLLGHAVIDHTKGTWIAPGVDGLETRPFNVPQAPASDWQTAIDAGRRNVTASSVAQLVRDAGDPNALTALYLDSQHRIVAVEPRPISSVTSAPNWVSQQLRAHDARRVILAAPEQAARFLQRTIASARPLAASGWAHDVLDVVGITHDEDGAPIARSYVDLNRIEPGLSGTQPGYAQLKRLFEPTAGYGSSVAGAGSDDAAAARGGRDRPGSEGATGRVPDTEGVSSPSLPPEAKAAFAAHAKSIDFDGSLERAAEHQKAGGLRERLNRFADAVSNGLGPIERLGAQPKVEASLPPSANPRDLLSYMKSSDYTVRTFLNDGVLDPVSRELVGPSFKSMFERFGNDTDAIKRALTYVKAQRDVGRGLQGLAGDQAALERAHAVVDYGRTDPQLQAFARDWHQFVDGVGQYAVKSGLWTPELWERMRASDALYVPYRRIRGATAKEIGEGLSAGPNTKRIVNVGPGVERFEGSRKAIANPAEAMAEYAGAIIRRADRYRIGASLFDAARALGPEGDFLLTPIKPADVPASLRGSVAADMRTKSAALGIDPEALAELHNTFDLKFDKDNPVIWRNGADGQREYAQVNSPDLWRAISALNAKEGAGVRALLDVTFWPLKRVFVATTTALNPRFALGTNPVRDAIDAVAKTRAGVTPMDIGRGYYEAIKELAHRSAIADEANRSGLGNTSMYTNEVRPRAFVRDQAPTSTSDVVRSRVSNAAALPIKALERVAEVSDKGPRLAEYLKTVTKYDYKVALGEWSPADLRLRAATNGRAVTLDFANKPGNPALRLAADYIPFFGPAMQAPISFARAAAANPVRVASVSASVALMAGIAWAMKHQLPPDQLDELNDRPANERAGFLFFPLDANRHVMRVPIGQELGLVAAGVTAGLDGLMDDDPHAGRLLQQAIRPRAAAGHR
jgi:DNA repair protein RadC